MVVNWDGEFGHMMPDNYGRGGNREPMTKADILEAIREDLDEQN